MPEPVRTLLFSTLYPSSAQPLRGVFVETRLRALLSSGDVATKVVAPVGWFPTTRTRHARYAALAATPKREVHNGIDVLHPRYVTIPKIGMSVAPVLLALGARAAVKQLRDEGFDFDVIDAHYYYPDGVAASLLGQWFGRPVVITARGTDVNLIPEYLLPRLQIRWAARQAAASIGVSAALVERLRDLGAATERLHVVPNGVDLQRFRCLDRDLMRAELGLHGNPILLCVGNLHEHKGQRLVVRALARLRTEFPDFSLYFVGDGPDREAIRAEVDSAALSDRVHFVGPVPNTELACWYSAADALLLASSREGWPNVLLEAMACGAPVVATRVGGVPEIVRAPVAGRLAEALDAGSFATAVAQLLRAGTDRAAVRRYAEGFGWDSTSAAQLELFRVLARRGEADRIACA